MTTEKLHIPNDANNRTCVLIVGAGPTGLMMACQLDRFGIPYRIIEKNDGPTTQSRALAIQARSLEIFAQMDVAQQAVEQGKPAKAVNYVVNGKVSQRIALEGLGEKLTEFPFLLILDQSKTERLLLDFVTKHGHTVEWQMELVSFNQDESNVSAVVMGSDGVQQHIQADWLVGADGGKSAVRHILDIPFGGKTYDASLYVLDCKVDLPFKDDEGYIAFSDTSFAALFPMTEGRCRIISTLPEDLSDAKEVTFDDVARGFAQSMRMDVKLSDPRWLSVYVAHHRYASAFQKGRCFLAGDAAHIHSPVGAQGMNTGLQDAYNLAWKLALAIVGKANRSLLDTYNAERLPIAKNLVQTTDKVFGLVASKNVLTRFWVMYVAPALLALGLKEKHVARFAFTTISQIGINYRHSMLAEDASVGDFPRHAPHPGDRLPHIEFQDSGKTVNLQAKIKEAAFHLFLFSGAGDEASVQNIKDVACRYNGAIVVETMPLIPETKTVYEALGIQNGGYYLIRPDMYIAFRSALLDSSYLATYLDRILIAPKL